MYLLVTFTKVVIAQPATQALSSLGCQNTQVVAKKKS